VHPAAKVGCRHAITKRKAQGSKEDGELLDDVPTDDASAPRTTAVFICIAEPEAPALR
jgi:hypothetical protein